MKNFSTKTIIISVIGLALVLYVWSSYNTLVKGNIAVDTQWAQVENQLQRQFDLIPNLEATAKGAGKNEKDIILGVAQARSNYSKATTVDGKVQAANDFQSAVSRFMVAVESNPVVGSTQLYANLQVSLEGTQNRIAVERGRFNDAVSMYNVSTKTFPKNIIASLFGFKDRLLFKADVEALKAPKVNF